MEYTTPIILSIVILTLSCAFSQRFFYRYLIKNNVCISFGKQKESIPPEITQPSDTITAEVEVIEVPTARNDYTDGYDERIAEIERKRQSSKLTLCVLCTNIPHIVWLSSFQKTTLLHFTKT